VERGIGFAPILRAHRFSPPLAPLAATPDRPRQEMQKAAAEDKADDTGDQTL
jgi:hypothetical protein